MTGECQEPTCILGYVYDPAQPRGKRNPPCPTCRPPRQEPQLPAIGRIAKKPSKAIINPHKDHTTLKRT